MNTKIALSQAEHELAQCQDWTNTAVFLGGREHAEALNMEWNAMVKVCKLEHELKRSKFPIATFKSSSMRRM